MLKLLEVTRKIPTRDSESHNSPAARRPAELGQSEVRNNRGNRPLEDGLASLSGGGHTAALEARIAHLAARNSELEHYLFAVSHSLKSSVVTIQGFLPLLESDLHNRNVERVLKDLGHIDQAADHLAHLLDSLPRVLSADHHKKTPRQLAMTDLVRRAADLLSGQFAARGVELDVAPDLPTVFGDRSQLASVVQNLLENAAKFMGEQRRPEITVGRQRDPEGDITFVRDNGIGIDPAAHQRIFELFHRLQPDIEGTGVGLTLAKKIVDLHEGELWLESEGLGRGTTFFLRLPNGPI